MKRVSLFAMAAIFAVLLAGLPAAAQTFVGAFDATTNESTELAALYSNLPHEAGPSNRLVRTDRVNPLLVGKGETSRPTKDGLALAAVHHGLQDPSECGRASFESR